MITYKKGDLLADEAFALVNTVNMGGVMGKGIALAFKNEFPFNYRCYVDACQGGLVSIGKMLCMDDTSLFYGKNSSSTFRQKSGGGYHRNMITSKLAYQPWLNVSLTIK